MKISSYAIWGGNIVVTAITSAMLVGNIGLQLSGKFTFSIPCES
jgi:hypothetical protein